MSTSNRENGFEIAGRPIGIGSPVYIVAEISANHHQDLGQALALIEAASAAGADAVKLQTYTADTITMDSDRPEFRVSGGTLWDDRSLYDLYTEAHTPWEWHPRLKEAAEALEMQLFSSPFDPSAVDFLEKMDVPAYKVASFELVDTPLIEKIARLGKPMILSTGMATLAEIDAAVTTAREAGATEIALLKCTSAYPASPDQMDLRTIPDLARVFQLPVGLSDHTLGMTAAISAVALGACLIEKHFTLSRDIPGPDSAFSLEPEEFRAMVEAVRETQRALGEVRYGVTSGELSSRAFRRSLYVVCDVSAGEEFTLQNVRSIRPANGLAPKHLEAVLGRRARRDLKRGEPMSWDFVE